MFDTLPGVNGTANHSRRRRLSLSRQRGGSLDHVDVRIGVTQAPREINLELADDADRDDLKARIEAALGGATDTLWITDKRVLSAEPSST